MAIIFLIFFHFFISTQLCFLPLAIAIVGIKLLLHALSYVGPTFNKIHSKEFFNYLNCGKYLAIVFIVSPVLTAFFMQDQVAGRDLSNIELFILMPIIILSAFFMILRLYKKNNLFILFSVVLYLAYIVIGLNMFG